MPKVPRRQLSHGEVLDDLRPKKNVIVVGSRNFNAMPIQEALGKFSPVTTIRADQFIEEIEEATNGDQQDDD